MVIALPNASARKFAVAYCLTERHIYDHFGNKMLHTVPLSNPTPAAANTNDSISDGESSVEAVEIIESALNIIHLHRKTHKALKQADVAELCRRTPIPANDNLILLVE